MSAAVAFYPAAGFLQVSTKPADALTPGNKKTRKQDQAQNYAIHDFPP
jgi:hypothetical protein